jgi:uncharacterized protein YcbK (DUF882 family)
MSTKVVKVISGFSKHHSGVHGKACLISGYRDELNSNLRTTSGGIYSTSSSSHLLSSVIDDCIPLTTSSSLILAKLNPSSQEATGVWNELLFVSDLVGVAAFCE